MSEILDRWEKEAERAGDPSDDLGLDVFWRERFLSLISLVRKKDEALWNYSRGFCAACLTSPRSAKEALALTDQVGGSDK